MCDTFVHIPDQKNRPVIFGKNSDREPNEAQQIVRFPKYTREQNSVRTTFIEVNHPKEINEVILSKPFQMWGAEMGINEFGVVIGNEAVFTKIPFENKNNGLTGMDMIRLSLEICKTAEESLHRIIYYIERYGQDVCSGYTDKNFFYHNSFLIADKNEGYVLETAGRHWVYQKVVGYRAISNGLSIEEDFDGISQNAVEFAQKKGWTKKNENFNFRKAYSAWLMPKLAACTYRREQSEKKGRTNEVFSVEQAFEILRSHHPVNFDPSAGSTASICMHASGLFTPHQTVGSMVAELRKDKPATVWLTGSAAPCLSVYKPFYFGDEILNEENFKAPTSTYDHSYWWQWEELHRTVLKNFVPRLNEMNTDRKNFEQNILIEDRRLVGGNFDRSFYNSLSLKALSESKILLAKWKEGTKQSNDKSHLFYSAFWKRQNKKCGFPVAS